MTVWKALADRMDKQIARDEARELLRKSTEALIETHQDFDYLKNFMAVMDERLPRKERAA